jgi:UDP:flavonoid glycosyltransferase YjiC (YdhE family)
MKYLLVTLGSIGDLMPFLAVADALRQRGHQVVIASNAGYAALVTGSGFEFGIVSDRPQQALDDVLESDPRQAWKRVWDEVFVPAAGPTRDFIAQHAQAGPCKVIASWNALGAKLARQEREFPLCTAYLSPHAVHEDRDLSGPRGEQIGLFPSWFGPIDEPDLALTGFPVLDDALVPALPPPLESFLQDGPAPVIFTPGSFMRRSEAFFREAMAACERLGLRAVFLTPHGDQIPQALPPTIRHFKFVSLQRLARHAAALVHHGGIGTCAQAMRAGIPQLIIPVFFDQPDNAARVEALGVGRRVARFVCDEVCEKLREILDDPLVRRNCTAVREKFPASDPVRQICEFAEALT